MRAVGTRKGRGVLLGVGAALAIILLLVIQVVNPGGLLGARTETSTVTATQQATDVVDSALAEHVLLLSSRNVSGLVSEYETNATVSWTGNANGLAGDYNGAYNIGILLGSFLGRFTNFTIENETQMVAKATSDGRVEVNSTFVFSGQSPVLGDVNGTVSALDHYVYSAASGTWLISQETWDFITLNIEYPVSAEGSCTTSLCPQWAENVAISEDGNYLAVGATVASGENGSVYLVSLQKPTQGDLWRDVTNTSVSSVAISSNGSYAAAGGYWSDTKSGHSEVFLFNNEGRLLWSVSTGSRPLAVSVAIAANGSRIAADYGRGILYLNTAGDILWNYTFPQGGTSRSFAMSSDAAFLAYSDENITIRDTTSLGWGIFYLNSQGHQLWSYTEDHVGTSEIQMSSDGSHLAAYSLLSDNGTIYYFGGTGKQLWDYSFTWQPGYAAYLSLAMASDGSYIAAEGGTGLLFFNSTGSLLWNEPVGGLPVAVFPTDSLIVTGGTGNADAQLTAYNGTMVGRYNLEEVSVVAGSPNGPVWVDVEGSIQGGGTCANLQVNSGTSQLASIPLC